MRGGGEQRDALGEVENSTVQEPRGSWRWGGVGGVQPPGAALASAPSLWVTYCLSLKSPRVVVDG